MIQKYTTITGKVDTGEKSAVRAVQAWIYLIGKAANRQTVKYSDLATLMGYTDGRPLGVILGCIMFYCEQNGLPPMTSIVVNTQGTPGPGYIALTPPKLSKAREMVFSFPWAEYTVPSVSELHDARVSARMEEVA